MAPSDMPPAPVISPVMATKSSQDPLYQTLTMHSLAPESMIVSSVIASRRAPLSSQWILKWKFWNLKCLGPFSGPLPLWENWSTWAWYPINLFPCLGISHWPWLCIWVWGEASKLKAGNLVDDSGERTAESVVLLAVPPSADLSSVSAQDAFSSSSVHRALDLRNASIVLFQVWM